MWFLNALAKVFAPVIKVVQTVAKAVQTYIQQQAQTVINNTPSASQPSNSQPASRSPSPEEQRELARQQEQIRHQQELRRREVGRDISQRELEDWDTPLIPRGGTRQRHIQPEIQPREIPAELRVMAYGNPLAKDVLLALQHEGKPEHLSDEAWLKRFASYGWDEKESQQAHRILIARKLQGVVQPDQDFIDLSQYLAVLQSGNYVYRDSNGNPVYPNVDFSSVDVSTIEDSNLLSYVKAYQTLVGFLDPNQFQGPNQELAWWHEDEEVTTEDIVSVIAFFEGRNDPSVRQAVYTRFLLYMGGDALHGFDVSRDEAPETEQLENQNLDRLLRFLAYYQPWREPGSVTTASGLPFNFDMTSGTVVYADGSSAPSPGANLIPTSTPRPNATIAAENVLTEVRQFFNNPDSVYIDQNGRSTLPPNVSLENWDFDIERNINDLRGLPFLFETRSITSNDPNARVWPDNISNVIKQHLDQLNNPGSTVILGTSGTVYSIIAQGNGQFTVVLTVQQNQNLGCGDITFNC